MWPHVTACKWLWNPNHLAAQFGISGYHDMASTELIRCQRFIATMDAVRVLIPNVRKDPFMLTGIACTTVGRDKKLLVVDG